MCDRVHRRRHLRDLHRGLRRDVARSGVVATAVAAGCGEARELRVWGGADRTGLDPVSRRFLSRCNRFYRLRRAGRVPVAVDVDPQHRRHAGVLGDGRVRRNPVAGLGVRVPRGSARVEVKPPVPQIPPPVWTEFKDLQEWEKYHQERTGGDRTSNTLAAIADSIHHMPGGWIVTTSTEKVFNWARK